MSDALMSGGRKLCFVTGATGLLGQSFIPRLLRCHPELAVMCLVRPSSGLSAEQRFKQLLNEWEIPEAELERIGFVEGDITEPRLGVTEPDYQFLCEHLNLVIHMAASIDFGLPLEEARLLNVRSTEQVVALCRSAKHRERDFRLVHISTAYVCGKAQGRLYERDLHSSGSFWNTYEQTKAEAEHVVREAGSHFPVTILRPSQVLGESETGRAGRFFGFFEYVELGLRGRVPVVVGNQHIRPDIVSSDYVSNGILALAFDPRAIGKTYHLAAGLEASLTLGEIVRLVVNEINAEATNGMQIDYPPIVPESMLDASLTPRQKTDFGFSPQRFLMATYGPYLEYERNFDVSGTHEFLASHGVNLPDISSVVCRSTRFAIRARTTKRRQKMPA